MLAVLTHQKHVSLVGFGVHEDDPLVVLQRELFWCGAR